MYAGWMRDAALQMAKDAADLSLAAVDLKTKANG